MRVITKSDKTKYYFKLIIKITISEKRKIAELWTKGKFALKKLTKEDKTKVVIGWFKLQLSMWLVDLNYNFESDWLIELSDNKLSDIYLESELVEDMNFLNQSQSRKL